DAGSTKTPGDVSARSSRSSVSGSASIAAASSAAGRGWSPRASAMPSRARRTHLSREGQTYPELTHPAGGRGRYDVSFATGGPVVVVVHASHIPSSGSGGSGRSCSPAARWEVARRRTVAVRVARIWYRSNWYGREVSEYWRRG